MGWQSMGIVIGAKMSPVNNDWIERDKEEMKQVFVG